MRNLLFSRSFINAVMRANRGNKHSPDLALCIWAWAFLTATIFNTRAEGARPTWNLEPHNPTVVKEGVDVTLTWNYNLGARLLRSVVWRTAEGHKIGEIRPPSSPVVSPKFRPRFKISNSMQATLIIRNVIRNDTGKYKCRVQNNMLKMSVVSTIRLDVQFPPEITERPKHQVVYEMKNVAFHCSASGNPPPTIKWIKNGTVVGNGTYYNEKAIQSGTYECNADNGIGEPASVSATLTVKRAYVLSNLTMKPYNETLKVKKNTPLYLRCDADADPEPAWTWFKDGKETKKGGSVLEIRAVDSSDAGRYTCRARNRKGEANATQDIIVLENSGKEFSVGISLAITSEKWNKKYEDRESQEFKSLTEKIVSELWVVYREKFVSVVKIEIFKLSEGSVVVHVRLIFDKEVSGDDVLSVLKNDKNGRLGEFTFDKSSVKSIAPDNPTSSCNPNPCEHGGECVKGKCSCKFPWQGETCNNPVMIIVLAVVLAVLLVLLVFLGLFWRRRKRDGRNVTRGQTSVQLSMYSRKDDGETKGYIIKAQDITQATPDYEIVLKKTLQEHNNGHYANLSTAKRSNVHPSRETVQPTSAAPTQPSDYASLDSAVWSWEVQRGNVTIEKVIGKGAFGQVAKATAIDLPGRPGQTAVAVKMLKENPSESQRRDLMAELELMKKLKRHPHVIKLLGCVTKSEPKMVLIEYVPYGDLLGYLRKSRGLNDNYYRDPDVKPNTSLTSQQLLKFAWQVADGMSFLSSNKIVHRDLAARNVLVGEGENCKVTDFGMARDIHQDEIYQKTTRGRLPVKWTAYEALMYGVYTTKSDVWSYGVVLFEIFTIGGCPYPRRDGRKIAELLKLGYRMSKPVHVDDELYQIMMNCWQQNLESRPTFDTLREDLKEMEKTHERMINMMKYDKKLYENVEDLSA